MKACVHYWKVICQIFITYWLEIYKVRIIYKYTDNSFYTCAKYFCFWRPLAQQEFFTKPKFSHIIEPCDCLAAPCDVISLDMYTLQVGDLEVIFYLFFMGKL